MAALHEIRFTVTDEYLSRALRAYWRRALSRHGFTWLALGLMLYALYKGIGRDYAEGVFYGVVALGLIGILNSHVRKSSEAIRAYFDRSPDRTTVIRFNENCIEDESAGRTLRIPWNFILKVWRGPQVWFLFFSQQVFLMLPAEQLTNNIRSFINANTRHGGKTDFLTCVTCSHVLVGCSQQTCPACGSPLPFERMGISPEEFLNLTTSLATGLAGKVHQPKIQAKSEEFFWSPTLVILTGLGAGLLTFLSVLVVLATLSEAALLLNMLLLLIIPASVMWLIGSRVRSLGHVGVFAVSHASGQAVPLTLLWCAASILRVTNPLPGRQLLVIIGYSVLSSVFVSWASWGVRRLVHGTAVVSEALSCSKCSFSLIGNVSGVCPECGTPVDFEQMGISPQGFSDLSKRMAENDSEASTDHHS